MTNFKIIDANGTEFGPYDLSTAVTKTNRLNQCGMNGPYQMTQVEPTGPPTTKLSNDDWNVIRRALKYRVDRLKMSTVHHAEYMEAKRVLEKMDEPPRLMTYQEDH